MAHNGKVSHTIIERQCVLHVVELSKKTDALIPIEVITGVFDRHRMVACKFHNGGHYILNNIPVRFAVGFQFRIRCHDYFICAKLGKKQDNSKTVDFRCVLQFVNKN